MELTFESVLKSLVGEADYNQFDSSPSKTASGVSTNQHATDVTGSGEDHGIDSQRVKRTYDSELVSNLGLGDLAKVSNMLNRDFINAVIFNGERNNGSREVRLTWPSKEIIGALAWNPTVADPHDGKTPMKKYEVVNTARGKGESDTPVYYVVNLKVKAGNRDKRRDEHNSRGDNQSFAGTWYDNPKDSTADFTDPRFAEKIRGRNRVSGSYATDSTSIGTGLVPQYSSSGMVFSDKNGTNKRTKLMFEADRPFRTSDLPKFVTREGAANGIAGHFRFDVTEEGVQTFGANIVTLMQRIGDKLADGTFHGDITAFANDEIVTNREVVYPGVDNEYYYTMDDVPAPDGSDWKGFLSELAKTSSGFGSASEIFGGLDDETVYALFAKCAIPVRLSRIYFARPALGGSINKARAESKNNLQNKTSTDFAKMIMRILCKGVEAGQSYSLPDGRSMFVFKSTKSAVHFPNKVYSAGKYTVSDKFQPMTLDVNLVGGVIRGNGGRDIFFLMPICTEESSGDPFVFLRYGDSDIGTEGGVGDCTTPENMSGGIMVSTKTPITSISFIAPEFEDAYSKFVSGTVDHPETKDTQVNYDNGPRVNMSVDDYVRRYGNSAKSDAATVKLKGPVTKGPDREKMDAIVSGDKFDASDKDIAAIADKFALDDAKKAGDFIDFSNSPEEIRRQIAAFDAKHAGERGAQMSDSDIEQIMDELKRSHEEDDRKPDLVSVGDTVDGDDDSDDPDRD